MQYGGGGPSKFMHPNEFIAAAAPTPRSPRISGGTGGGTAPPSSRRDHPAARSFPGSLHSGHGFSPDRWATSR
eukprot:9451765-Pyramimonas_sp.AAC.1